MSGAQMVERIPCDMIDSEARLASAAASWDRRAARSPITLRVMVRLIVVAEAALRRGGGPGIVPEGAAPDRDAVAVPQPVLDPLLAVDEDVVGAALDLPAHQGAVHEHESAVPIGDERVVARGLGIVEHA